MDSDDAHGAQPQNLILGTAGHIDHGKTALVRALTGVDTDRLPEEKRRGITIELGFAELVLGGVTFGVVDVPGHEKFVRTMVAGATGIDVALIVVAANDSVMPQTVEHVEILDLLGVQSGVVAITKSDLADEETLEIVELETRELLARTALREAPLVRCSSIQGTGLDDLRQRLVEAATKVSRSHLDLPFRMPVDRVFSVPGRGTVVTGSVISGQLRPGDRVEIWPGGIEARVREVQTHGRSVSMVFAGQRSAINLQGANRDALMRGSELAAVGTVQPASLLDAHLNCLPTCRAAIRKHAMVRLCLGAREVLARCVSLSGEDIAPGEAVYVQFRCTEAVAATFGQRFIVRDENAARTVGGGIILRSSTRRVSSQMVAEIEGLKGLHHGNAIERVAEVMRTAGFTPLPHSHIALAANVDRNSIPAIMADFVGDGRAVVLSDVALHDDASPVSHAFLKAFDRRALAWLSRHHALHPDDPGCLLETFSGWLERRSQPGLGPTLLRRLEKSGEIKIVGRYACLKSFAPALSAEDERVLAKIVAVLDGAAFQPPIDTKLPDLTGANTGRIQKLLKVARSCGQLIQVANNIHLTAEREAELRRAVGALFAASGPFTLSQMRSAIETTRKYAVPFAEYLDRIGYTKRSGDQRVVVGETQ